MFKTQYLFKWMMFPCLRVSEISFTLRGKRKFNTNSEAMSRALILVIKASTACWNVIFTVIIFLSQWNTYFASVFLQTNENVVDVLTLQKVLYQGHCMQQGKFSIFPVKRLCSMFTLQGLPAMHILKKKKKKASHMY